MLEEADLTEEILSLPVASAVTGEVGGESDSSLSDLSDANEVVASSLSTTNTTSEPIVGNNPTGLVAIQRKLTPVLQSLVGKTNGYHNEPSTESQDASSSPLSMGIEKPEWQPDDAATQCRLCSTEFTFWRRKHHCRMCGHIFCTDCCNTFVTFPPEFDYTSPQRVCSGCLPRVFLLLKNQSSGPASSKLQTVSPSQNSSTPTILSNLDSFLAKVTTADVLGKIIGKGSSQSKLDVQEPIFMVARETISVPKHYDKEKLKDPDDSNEDFLCISIYSPQLAESDNGLPCIVWFRDGWMSNSISDNIDKVAENDYVDNYCRYLVKRLECVVVSVKSRPAPAFVFPTQQEDAYRVLQYISTPETKILTAQQEPHNNEEQTGKWRIDPKKVIVGGDGFGANLAASVCLMARDRSHKPDLRLTHLPLHLLMVYPVLNLSCTSNKYFENDEDDLDEYASPILASSLKGMPASTLVGLSNHSHNDTYNRLHLQIEDEIQVYCDRMKMSGIQAEKLACNNLAYGFLRKQYSTLLDDYQKSKENEDIDLVLESIANSLSRVMVGDEKVVKVLPSSESEDNFLDKDDGHVGETDYVL
eukprot:TRINITY_DN6225_c0_g1_i1.p1 TRINITY_DN6225_c0_g1~~TRINITY_DN6225_c0_g1_i1.p1  ORF type:complete len:587 (-),score=132.56 TRINITY_DN6225_c0_g1_i1:89-1849(-)